MMQSEIVETTFVFPTLGRILVVFVLLKPEIFSSQTAKLKVINARGIYRSAIGPGIETAYLFGLTSLRLTWEQINNCLYTLGLV